MTESLFHKLEEKMMALLSEVENLRKDVLRLSQDNAALKAEKENHSRKLQDLISLLDAVNTAENGLASTNVAMTASAVLTEQ